MYYNKDFTDIIQHLLQILLVLSQMIPSWETVAKVTYHRVNPVYNVVLTTY